MDAEHIASRRDLRRYARSSASMSAEFGILGLCILSGVVGVYYEDVKLTFTIFIGGLMTWLALQVPTMVSTAKGKNAEATKVEDDKSTKPKVVLPPTSQVMSLIKSRRSVFPKDFNGSKVSKEDISMMLEAAIWAPTHNLVQPWRFIVLEGDSKSKFESITIDCVGKYTQPAEKAEEALAKVTGKAKKAWPLVSHYIVICMVPNHGKGGKRNPEWEDICAVACAVQNLHLTATSLGVCGYWSSWQAVARDTPEMSEFLGLDTSAGERCLGVFSVGHSDRAGGYRGSRAPLDTKVVWKS